MKLSFEKEGIHETKIRRYFDEFEVPAETKPLNKPICIIVFMNRSGSSLICENMRATKKFTGFGEPLNYELVIKRAQEHDDITSFPEYLNWLTRKIHKKGTMFGMKASCDQVMMLLRSGAIPRYFNDVRWVFIQRRDILSQAVSFSIAQQTQQWHSFQSGNEREARYDFKDIKKRIQTISDTYSSMQAFFSLFDIDPYHIYYEDFVADTVAGTAKLASYLEVEDVEIDPSRLRMEKQRSGLNKEFRAQFVRDFEASLSINK